MKTNSSSILFPLGHFYPANIGGPSNTIYWQAKALQNRGERVTVVTSNVGIDTLPIGKWLDTNYGRVIYVSTQNLHFPWRLTLKAISQLKHAKVIHLTSLFHFPSLIIAIANTWYNKPLVWSPRGELESSALGFQSAFKKFYLQLIKLFVNKRTTFHATSDSEKNNIVKVFGDGYTVYTLPNFISLPAKLELPVKEQLLFVGRLHPIKNLDIVLKAIASSAIFMKSGFTFCIAGDEGFKGYKSFLQDLCTSLGISEKVTFIGPVYGKAKEELFASSYYSILASRSENFGNVVVESLAQGTPVIASTGTPWQILSNKDAGDWIEPKEIELKAAIEKAIEMSGSAYKKQRENAYSLAINEFDIEKNIDKWQSLYNQISHN